MSQEVLMLIDAGLLLWTALACGILLCADSAHRHWLPTLVLCVIGVSMTGHALWLLGVWWPRAGGYPLPRLSGDAAIAIYFAWRVLPVVKEQWCLDRRLKKIRRMRQAQSKR